MILLTCSQSKTPRLAAMVGDGVVVDVAAMSDQLGTARDDCGPPGPYVDDVLREHRLSEVVDIVDAATDRLWSTKDVTALPTIDLDTARLCPPVGRTGTIIASGRNFHDHLAEGQEIWSRRGSSVHKPQFPLGFVKVRTSIIGARDPIVIPRGSTKVDYEVELVAVLDRRLESASVAEAESAIAGYTVLNDVSEREIQFREMEGKTILLGKNLPTFGPVGPYFVTADEFGDDPFELSLTVNGQTRQRSTSAMMIFTMPELVAYWSRMGLDPGDAVTSGTPSGVAALKDEGYLTHGDVVEASVSGIGSLVNPVVSAEKS